MGLLPCCSGARGSAGPLGWGEAEEGTKGKRSWRREGRRSDGAPTKTVMKPRHDVEIQGFCAHTVARLRCPGFCWFRGKEQTGSIFQRDVKNGVNPHLPQEMTCKRCRRKIMLWFRLVRDIQLLCSPGKSVWSLDMSHPGLSSEASFSWMPRRSPNRPRRKFLLVPCIQNSDKSVTHLELFSKEREEWEKEINFTRGKKVFQNPCVHVRITES